MFYQGWRTKGPRGKTWPRDTRHSTTQSKEHNTPTRTSGDKDYLKGEGQLRTTKGRTDSRHC